MAAPALLVPVCGIYVGGGGSEGGGGSSDAESPRWRVATAGTGFDGRNSEDNSGDGGDPPGIGGGGGGGTRDDSGVARGGIGFADDDAFNAVGR